MFTGIIEELAEIASIKQIENNLRIGLTCSLTDQLKIDQSISHNGACLTVVNISGENYFVDVVKETLTKTNIGNWKVGDKVNIERSVTMKQRMDGHIVQGHVDTRTICKKIEDEEGSKRFWFSYPEKWASHLIPKGSVSVNGVSLTIADLSHDQFSVAVIPYTFSHTNFQFVKVGDIVNIEFDMIGKYVNRIATLKE